MTRESERRDAMLGTFPTLVALNSELSCNAAGENWERNGFFAFLTSSSSARSFCWRRRNSKFVLKEKEWLIISEFQNVINTSNDNSSH